MSPERLHLVTAATYRSDMTKNLGGWLGHMFERNLAKRTVGDYRDNVTRFAAQLDGTLTEATTDDIRGWLNQPNLKASTRKQYRSSLLSFYTWCVKVGLRPDNPVLEIAVPRVDPGLPRPIQMAEIVRVMCLADQPLRSWIALGALAGLRRNEITYLASEDIDSGRLRIKGKGGHIRYVQIHPRVQCELDDWGIPPAGRLWEYHATYVGQTIAVYLRAEGINATCHQLRHSFATECYRQCRDLLQVKQLLGHSNVATTQVYVAVVDDGASVVAMIAA